MMISIINQIVKIRVVIFIFIHSFIYSFIEIEIDLFFLFVFIVIFFLVCFCFIIMIEETSSKKKFVYLQNRSMRIRMIFDTHIRTQHVIIRHKLKWNLKEEKKWNVIKIANRFKHTLKSIQTTHVVIITAIIIFKLLSWLNCRFNQIAHFLVRFILLISSSKLSSNIFEMKKKSFIHNPQTRLFNHGITNLSIGCSLTKL